jgi:hypothetical protein
VAGIGAVTRHERRDDTGDADLVLETAADRLAAQEERCGS